MSVEVRPYDFSFLLLIFTLTIVFQLIRTPLSRPGPRATILLSRSISLRKIGILAVLRFPSHLVIRKE